MTEKGKSRKELLLEIDDLRSRLGEAEETLRAIRGGEVDAIVCSTPQGDRVYTLRGAEHPYRVFFEEMNEGAVTMTFEGLILNCNPRFAEMVKLPYERVVGMSFLDFVREDARQSISRVMAEGGPERRALESALEVEGDDAVPVNISVGLLETDEMEALCVVVTDLSALRVMEKLRETNEALASVNREIRISYDRLKATEEHLRESRRAALNILEDAIQARQLADEKSEELRLEIAERMRAEKALQESDQRMQQALDVSRSFTFEWQPATDRVLRSASCGPILGLSGDEACNDTGRNFFQCVHPDDRAQFEQTVTGLTPSANSYTTEYRVVRPDRSVVVLEEVGQAAFDSAGKIQRLVGVTTDVTARKRAEEELRWTSRRNKLLSDTAARLLHTDDPQGEIESLCRQVMEFLECDVFFNFLVDEGEERLHLNACAGITEGEARKIERLDYGVAVCGSVALSGERIIAEDILNTPDPRTELVKSFGIQSYCCHPLTVQGHVIGTLSFGSRTLSRFRPEEVDVMRTVTDLVAIAMHRIETQERLSQSRAHLAWVLKITGVGTWLNEMPLGHLNWDEKTRSLFFVPPEAEPTIELFWSRLHPTDREPTRLAVEEAIRTRTLYEIDHRAVNPDTGEIRWIRSVGQATYAADGTPTRFDGINYDISARKDAEAALFQSREDLDRAQAVGQIGSWRMDVRHNVLTWSDENYRIFGVDRGTPLTYESFLAAIHPEDREYVDMMWQAALRGEPYDIEHRIVADGRVKWVREKAFLEFEEGGVLIGGFGIAQDTTDRKEAEAALRQSETSLRSAREALQKANEELECRIRERTRELRRTNRDLEQRTYDLNERVKELNCLYTVSHLLTGDAVPLITALQKAVNVIPSGFQFSEIAGAGIVLNSFKVKTDNYRDTPWKLWKPISIEGTVRGMIRVAYCEKPPVLESGLFMHEEEVLLETLAELVGDFVDRLRSRTRLEESEERYRRISRQFQALLDAIPDVLVLVSPNRGILWANSAAKARMGVTSEDLTGQTCGSLWTNLAENVEFCPAGGCFRSGQQIEARFGALGTAVWDVKAIPVRGDDGTVVNVIIDARDITAELRLQEEAVRSARLASLGELAAGVAHEINNPINSVINYAQILANRADRRGEEGEFAVEIVREGERIAAIVRGLLGFAREMKDIKQPTNIQSVLTATLVLTNAQLKRDGIRLRMDVPEDLPPVLANHQQLQQVFLNVISNARYALNRKYQGPHEDKILEISGKICAVEGGPGVCVEVRDHGTGIPKDLLGRVATPFFTTKPPSEGTGLGLSISHGIVADHGGQLTIDSVEGEYTSVTITLPAEAQEETP